MPEMRKRPHRERERSYYFIAPALGTLNADGGGSLTMCYVPMFRFISATISSNFASAFPRLSSGALRL